MTTPDLINGCAEGIGAAIQYLNCTRLYRDKSIRGYNWWSAIFYVAWGMWNLYYYPHLHQWASFTAGAALALMNTIWISMAIRYELFGKE